MASKKTKRRNKKKGGYNKNRRNTKRQQRGGLIHKTRCDANGENCIHNESEFSESKKYIRKMPIVSPDKKNSIFDFIPKNEDGKTMIELLSGNIDSVKDRKDIDENIYVKKRIDLELEDLYSMIQNDPKYRDIIKNILLSKSDLLKKTTILRLLFTLYKGEPLTGAFVYDGTSAIEDITGDIKEITLRDHPIFFGLIRGTFKNVYRPDHSANISTNIFKNGLLEDCYRDIENKDVISFMTIVIGDNDKNKFSRIYSPENYDYVRQAILFFVINRSFAEFDLFIQSLENVVTDARTNNSAAVAPRP
jgi:hypothetical protein